MTISSVSGGADAHGPYIDHVIILVPYSYLEHPPSWIKDNFVLSPGGKHADGRTENRLILLQDGSYLELIAFIDDNEALRKGHWWDKPFGIVDFCLSASTDIDWHALNHSIITNGSEAQYDTPQSGGRKRPDGVDISWEVTFPRGVERGLVPFWCFDKTPRENRVPVTTENTRHPCGALGMSAISITTDEKSSRDARAVLSAITSQQNVNGTAVDKHVGQSFTFSRLLSVAASTAPAVIVAASTDARPRLKLALQVSRVENQPQAVQSSIGTGSLDISFSQA